MIKTILQQSLEIIEAYKNLNLGNKKVQCPYFMNTGGTRAGLKVMLGKGSPKEIEEETKLIAARDKVELANLEPERIREFMKEKNLGIDCSGFIGNVLWAENEGKVKQLAKNRSGRLLRKFLASFRPLENLSVLDFTNEKNSVKLEKWQGIAPGDMIRTRNGKHVLLVEQTEHNDSGKLCAITYVHSTNAYGDENGVREGKILVTKLDGAFEEQDWQEIDPASRRNITYEGLLDGETNGIYRLR